MGTQFCCVLRIFYIRFSCRRAASPLPIARLPTELSDLIISNVSDTATLHSLTLSCRAFALTAEPRLYASLKLTTKASSLKLARTLVQSPRKSLFVFDIVAELFDIEFVVLPAGMKLVLQAIVGCPNLSSLSTSWRPSHKWVFGFLLSSRFQLYRFVSWFQWDEGVCRFLETQPSLVELVIVRPGPAVLLLGGDPGVQLSHSALPRLSSLKSRLPQAAAIVPGRPVSSLSIYGAVTLTNLESALPMLAQSSVQMDYLSLQTGELSSTLLTLLSAYLPSISSLEIRVVRNSMVRTCMHMNLLVRKSLTAPPRRLRTLT